MRKGLIGLVVMALMVTACGGDGAPSTSTTAAATTTTTAVATTTTAATTTTVDPAGSRAEAAAEWAGEYEGEWNNTTFGSSGSIAVSFEVDVEALLAILTLDLGGRVFGQSDPDPLTVEFDLLEAGPYAGSVGLFGEFSVEADQAGRVTLRAPLVPGVGGRELVVEGQFVDGEFTGTYSIAGLAEGTLQARRTE